MSKPARSKKDQWACSGCSYFNPQNRRRCRVCNTDAHNESVPSSQEEMNDYGCGSGHSAGETRTEDLRLMVSVLVVHSSSRALRIQCYAHGSFTAGIAPFLGIVNASDCFPSGHT